MINRKPRSDKGKKRVDHSGYDRIYTFKLNSKIESDCVTRIDSLIAQRGSIKEAMRFLLTGDSEPAAINAQSFDEKLSRIMEAIEALGSGTKGKITGKQKATVVDAVKDYCHSLSDFMS